MTLTAANLDEAFRPPTIVTIERDANGNLLRAYVNGFEIPDLHSFTWKQPFESSARVRFEVWADRIDVVDPPAAEESTP